MIRLAIYFCAFVLLVSFMVTGAGAAETTHFFDRTPYKVTLQGESALREIAALNLDVVRGSVREGVTEIVIYLNPDEVNLLKALGYRLESTPDEGYLGFLREQARRDSGGGPTRDYHTYETLLAELQSIVAEHPGICQLINIGPTIQSRSLWFMKISDNVTLAEDEPEFKYISSIHGNEVVGKEMCMYLINYLVDNYGVDPTVTTLVDEVEIWIMPSMNPDGTANGSRYNANGVDLNRDFPDRVSDPINTTAGRQIEVANVMNWGFTHHPLFSANFHCGELVANYPWDHSFDPQANADNTDYEDLVLAASYTYTTTNLPMWNNNTPPFVHGTVNGVAWYQIDGGMQDWNYHWMGDMDITMEISNVNWPAGSTLPTYWNDNRQSMINYMQYALRGIRGLVTDSVTGLPLDAQVGVVGRPDLALSTDPQVGDYHTLLIPGTYNLDVSSFGYWPKHLTDIQVLQGAATRRDVALRPANHLNFTGILHNPSGGALSARLWLLNTPYDSVQTNTGGQFTFSNVYEGEYILRILNLNGGALLEMPVTLYSGMPAPELWGPVAVMYDGFESGLSAWTLQGTWGTAGNAYAGVLSLSDSPSGNYGSNLNMPVTYNTPLNLTAYDYATLSYRIKYNYETNFDSLFTEVSTNGTTWSRVKSYNCRQDNWTLETADLNSYLSASGLRLRYRLVTDGSVVRDGGFIDEARICVASTTPFGGPSATITLTPSGAPIQIPAIGGTFTYNIAVASASSTQVTGSVWCNVTLPSGSVYGPTLGPVTITLNPGVTLNRNRNQAVPGSAPAGSYVYHGYVGNYPGGAWDQDDFPFTKLGSDEAGIAGWFNSGEPFPDEMASNAILPQQCILAQNFPNPFNPTTEICFALPQAGRITLKVFNTAGQLVATLAQGYRPAGWQKITWDAAGLATGLYLVQLNSAGLTLTQKAILIK
jgi:hypothetical protein